MRVICNIKTDFWQKKCQENKLSVSVSLFASLFAFLGKTMSNNVQEFLHGVPKTGVVTERFKNLNNCEPRLRISFKVNMVNIRYISNSWKRIGKTVKRLYSGTFHSWNCCCQLCRKLHVITVITEKIAVITVIAVSSYHCYHWEDSRHAGKNISSKRAFYIRFLSSTCKKWKE